MISPSNTSPRLTSDLAGNANPAYHAGYFRVSSNDLHQARALSGLRLQPAGAAEPWPQFTTATPYTSALRGGVRRRVFGPRGKVPAQAEIEKGAPT